MTTIAAPSRRAPSPAAALLPQGWAPSREQLVDAGFAVALTILAAVGFRSAFGSNEPTVIASIGGLLGAAVALTAARLHWPLVLTVVVAAVVFVVVGGPLIVADECFLGIVPSPESFSALVDGAVHGWAALITTLPPAGDAGNLLTVPWVCGLVAGLASTLIANATKVRALVVAPPAALLAAAVLVGTERPVALVLEGGAFAGVAVTWLALRHSRAPFTVLETARNRRIVSGGALLVVSAALAHTIAPSVPFLDTDQRYLLREQLDPVFDPADLPSPLSGLRRYLSVERSDDVLLEVSGLPAGVALRYAVMDSYDGVVWAVGGAGESLSGLFRAVGSEIPTDVRGERIAVDTTVRGLSTVWLALPGRATAVAFPGATERTRALEERLRFNTVTGTAVVVGKLGDGDRLHVEAVLPPVADRGKVIKADVDPRVPVPEIAGLPDDLKAVAGAIVAGATSPFEQALKLEEIFHEEGFYSDGDGEAGGVGGGTDVVPPGHSLAHLRRFLADTVYIGNEEQYSAAMAVLARTLGLPARVVMGFRPAAPDAASAPDGSMTVTGADVTAWVEIAFDGYGWVPFHPTPDRSRTFTGEAPPTPPDAPVDVQAPPPTLAALPPTTAPADETSSSTATTAPVQPPADGEGIPTPVLVAGAVVGIPATLLGLAAATIIGLKARRRRRRWRRPSPVARISGGWAELVDELRDHGRPIPATATRRELAAALPLTDVPWLARDADSAIFGPDPIADVHAEQYWDRMRSAVAELRRNAGRLGRFKAAMTTTSLHERGDG